MNSIRIISLILLAALPFLISSLLGSANKGMERRNTLYRCFIPLCRLFTNNIYFRRLPVYVKLYFRKMPKSKNARKLFLYITGILLLSFQFIDYCVYINGDNFHYLFTQSYKYNIDNYSTSLTPIPYEYILSFILTIPLFIYKAGNTILLSLKICDDRLFLVANLLNFLVIFTSDANVSSIVIYTIFTASVYYTGEFNQNNPKAKEPITNLHKEQINNFNEIKIAA